MSRKSRELILTDFKRFLKADIEDKLDNYVEEGLKALDEDEKLQSTLRKKGISRQRFADMLGMFGFCVTTYYIYTGRIGKNGHQYRYSRR